MPIEYQAHREFSTKVRNFPEAVYNADDPQTHLYHLMWTLLEDPGVGQLKKFQTVARLGEFLGGTMFGDLDFFFGEFLGLPRLPNEQYLCNPFQDQLSSAEWSDVHAKDASYRGRIHLFLQALLRGGTNEGMALVAEAACGHPCQVIELWRLVSGGGMAETFGRVGAAKEFVIVPLVTEPITMDEQMAIVHAVDRLKPVNTVATVDQEMPECEIAVSIRYACSPSEYFEIRKFVMPDGRVHSNKGWLIASKETEAPTFAFHKTHGGLWSLNHSVVTISTFTLDDAFRTTIGTVNTTIGNGDTTLLVDETQAPAAPVFKIKVESEVMLVTNRQSDSSVGTRYRYTISRAQDGTTAAGHADGLAVSSSYIRLITPLSESTQQFGPWVLVERADSPDNFPLGKFAGDPNKYDANGEYVFPWTTQSQFVGWFVNQVELVGGQMQGSEFRLPISLDVTPGQKTRPEDSLAAPELVVRSKFYPEA